MSLFVMEIEAKDIFEQVNALLISNTQQRVKK